MKTPYYLLILLFSSLFSACQECEDCEETEPAVLSCNSKEFTKRQLLNIYNCINGHNNHLNNVDLSTLGNKIQDYQKRPFSANSSICLKNEFNLHYEAENSINNIPQRISLVDFLDVIGYDSNSPSNLGYALYPIIYTEGLSNTYSYIVVQTTCDYRNNKKVKPVKDENGLFHPFLIYDNSIVPIDTHQFNDYLAYYDSTVVLSDLNCTTHNVQDLNHPGACFFPFDTLSAFLTDNYSPTYGTNYELKFENVVSLHNNVLGSDMAKYFLIHSVLQTILKEGEPLLDDVTYPDQPYKNRALDLGYLCPPECN